MLLYVNSIQKQSFQYFKFTCFTLYCNFKATSSRQPTNFNEFYIWGKIAILSRQ